MPLKPIVTARAAGLKSPIRDILGPARKLAAGGKKMYYFNIGDPNKFDFDTPRHMREAMKRVMDTRAGYYSDSEGDMTLLRKIAEYESKKTGANISHENVVFTTGLSEALMFLMGALLEPGDEILLPSPTYPPYADYATFFGGVPVTYDCIEKEDWQPDAEDVRRKITPLTKAIVIINPNNPTGAVYPPEAVKRIIGIAAEAGIPVISDEIYDRMIFRDVPFASAVSLAKDSPVVLLNGFSKNFLSPGWRAGYVCFHNPTSDRSFSDLEEGFKRQARLRLSSCTPIELALHSAWENADHFKEIRQKLSERAEAAHKMINSIPGLSARKPAGAFYIFPKVDLSAGGWATDKEFVLDVLQNTGLVLVNGDGFLCRSHFRSVILPPVPVLEEAFGKLKAFMEALPKKRSAKASLS